MGSGVLYKALGGVTERPNDLRMQKSVIVIGTFYSDLTEIPYKIIERIATQINVDDIQNGFK